MREEELGRKEKMEAVEVLVEVVLEVVVLEEVELEEVVEGELEEEVVEGDLEEVELAVVAMMIAPQEKTARAAAVPREGREEIQGTARGAHQPRRVWQDNTLQRRRRRRESTRRQPRPTPPKPRLPRRKTGSAPAKARRAPPSTRP